MIDPYKEILFTRNEVVIYVNNVDENTTLTEGSWSQKATECTILFI